MNQGLETSRTILNPSEPLEVRRLWDLVAESVIVEALSSQEPPGVNALTDPADGSKVSVHSAALPPMSKAPAGL